MTIFRTKIQTTVPGEIIGQDDRGNPIYSDPEVLTHYGEFRPLAGEERNLDGDNIKSRFRVFLPTTAADVTGWSSLELSLIHI